MSVIGFQPLNLQALYALNVPEAEYAIDGVLPVGSLCLLSAREKGGKGFLTIDALASIAAGEPFLDRAVMEGPAIYCAAEENIRDVRARVRQRTGGREDLPLSVLPLDGSTDDRLDLDRMETVAQLAQMILERRPIAVGIDVLREIHHGKEDSADEMAPRLKPLRELAHQTNTTIILTHHASKAGGFRGSTAIRAAADLEWAFTRSEDENSMSGTLRIDGRHGPRQTLSIRFDPETARWHPATMLTMTDASLRGRILTTLQDEGVWMKPEDLVTATGVRLKTIQNELSRMNREIPLPFAVSGIATRGNPRQYHTLSPFLQIDPQVDIYNSSHSFALGAQELGNHPKSTGNSPGIIPSPDSVEPIPPYPTDDNYSEVI